MVHNKELHERNLCKKCETIRVGSAHKEDHEKTVHGIDNTNPTIRPGTQPTIKETKAQKKGWIQPKKSL